MPSAHTRPATRFWLLLGVLALLGATVGLGLSGSDAEPAGAGLTKLPFNDGYGSRAVTVNGSYHPIAGDFDCDGTAREILWYAPGPAPDYYWKITGHAGGGLQYTSTPLTINGTYEPFVVVYDQAGNCVYDIFWYAPGPARDYVWDVNSPGAFGYTSVPQTVNGDYTPIYTQVAPAAGIFWYAPGSATDYLWSLDQLGNITKGTGPQVSGTYRPVLAADSPSSAGILWYRPGTGPDYFWDGLALNTSSPGRDVPVTINGTYRPHTLSTGTEVLLYGPGSAPDHMIQDIDAATGGLTTRPGTVNGTYRVATTLLHPDLIVWHAPGSARDYIWFAE